MTHLRCPRPSKSEDNSARPLATRSCFVPSCGVRLEDPSDNGGRGWRRLEAHEVTALAYLAIRLIRKRVRTDLAGRDASKADEAARRVAEAVSQRLAAYPVFGAQRPAGGHSAGRGSCEGERQP